MVAAIVFLCSGLVVAGAQGLTLPSHIASSMVVQRDQPFEITGVATPNAIVTVTFAGKPYTCKAGADGRFGGCTIPAQPASTTPATISVASSSSEATLQAAVVLDDVLFGDVFLSSGQSNMELTVAWCYNYAKFVAESAQYGATLRIAQVALLEPSYNVSTPQTNLTLGIPWRRAGPDANVAGMSAIAYFTALEMVKANPSVPIGAIASSWGGTAMAPWTPPSGLKACGIGGEHQHQHRQPDPAGRTNPDPGLYSPDRHPAIELTAGPPSIPSTLWNSMIAPLLNLHISGVYWYQGESNCGDKTFERCFPAMITSWREAWKSRELPFIFFQLAPWPNLESGAIAQQRMAQVNATNLPKVGMVVAADRGDAAGAFHPIHPPVKEELSHRAFLVTDNLVYGNSSSPVQGPQPIRATFETWDASWADFHYGTGVGSYVCHAGSGFSCGGIKVEFDQDLVLASTYGQSNAWVAGGLAPSRQSSNDLLLWDSTATKFQRAEITAVAGKVLQLNVTWAYGGVPPVSLAYAMSDYPAMPFYNSLGQPTPPFVIGVGSA